MVCLHWLTAGFEVQEVLQVGRNLAVSPPVSLLDQCSLTWCTCLDWRQRYLWAKPAGWVPRTWETDVGTSDEKDCHGLWLFHLSGRLTTLLTMLCNPTFLLTICLFILLSFFLFLLHSHWTIITMVPPPKAFCSHRQPYHPAAQDWLSTEVKQGWAWSVPGWETSWEN